MEPDSALTTTNLGLALLDCGQPLEALAHFREAVRLSPDQAVVHHNLGNVLRILGRTREARESYREAIRLDPKLTLSYLHVGMTWRDEGSLAEALTWCRIAAELEPDNLDLWKHLAGLYEERHEPDEALACLRRIGDPLSEDGRPDESEDTGTNGEAIRPIQDEAQFSSATILVGAGPRELDVRGRTSDLPAGLAALEQGPALRRARRGLSLLARGQAAEALPHFQEAVRLRPDEAVLHHHLGHALRILGRTGEAQRVIPEGDSPRPRPHALVPSHRHHASARGLPGRRPEMARVGRRAEARQP